MLHTRKGLCRITCKLDEGSRCSTLMCYVLEGVCAAQGLRTWVRLQRHQVTLKRKGVVWPGVCA